MARAYNSQKQPAGFASAGCFCFENHRHVNGFSLGREKLTQSQCTDNLANASSKFLGCRIYAIAILAELVKCVYSPLCSIAIYH